jgi:hypothetical protein
VNSSSLLAFEVKNPCLSLETVTLPCVVCMINNIYVSQMALFGGSTDIHMCLRCQPGGVLAAQRGGKVEC